MGKETKKEKEEKQLRWIQNAPKYVACVWVVICAIYLVA